MDFMECTFDIKVWIKNFEERLVENFGSRLVFLVCRAVTDVANQHLKAILM